MSASVASTRTRLMLLLLVMYTLTYDIEYTRIGMREVVWIYMPISKNDKITAFGVRPTRGSRLGENATPSLQHPRLLFRMALAGDVGIGYTSSDSSQDVANLTGPEPLLAYDVPKEDAFVIMLGTYPATGKQASIQPLEPFSEAVNRRFRPYFSAAPLQNIKSTQVFQNDRGYCYGILFEYTNGSRQAVGQCRVGLDTPTYCAEPKSMWIKHCTYCQVGRDELQRVQVEVGRSEKPKRPSQGDWRPFSLTGVLHYDFTHREHFIMVLQ